MNRNFRDIAVRVVKTFIQAAGAVLLVGTVGLVPALIVGLISALFAFGTNLFGITPTSIPGRAAATFLQTFLATFAASGYLLNEAVIVSAAAAALSATINFVKETS